MESSDSYNILAFFKQVIIFPNYSFFKKYQEIWHEEIEPGDWITECPSFKPSLFTGAVASPEMSSRRWRPQPPDISHSHASPHSTSRNSSKWPLGVLTFTVLLASASGKQIPAMTGWIPLSPDLRMAVCPANSVFWWIKKNHWNPAVSLQAIYPEKIIL